VCSLAISAATPPALGSGGDDVVEAAPPCMAPGRGASRSRGGLGHVQPSAADLRGLWRSPSWWSRRQEKQGRGVLLRVGGEEGAGGRVSKARRPLSQGSMSAASIPRSRRWWGSSVGRRLPTQQLDAREVVGEPRVVGPSPPGGGPPSRHI
jgi:hypothetical protein